MRPMIERAEESDKMGDLLVLAIGVAISLCVAGYQFGRGNLTVYLLDGLHQQYPDLLKNDWFTTSTLQYHAAFTYLTSGLNRVGLLEIGFLVGYLILMVLWHLGWLRWTVALGGSRQTYLVSVLLYFLSAGGISVGVYQFLQDSCFLPSNVSNIAMLWACYFLTRRRDAEAGACLGVAGFFHLNYAAIGLVLWGCIVIWRWIDRSRLWTRNMIVGALLVGVPSMINIALALKAKLQHSGNLPMDEFVRIYVRFRHTHHFDPLAWPIGLWISFLWAIPLAAWAYFLSRRIDPARGENARQDGPLNDARRETARIFLFFLGLQVIAFLFAGVWYVSESLVQMILWRFSIYVKMLSCVGAAWLICDAGLIGAVPRRVLLTLPPVILAIAIGVILSLTPQGGDVATLVINSAHEHRAALILLVALSTLPFFHEFRGLVPKAGILAAIAALILVISLGWNRWLGVGMAPPPIDAEYLSVCEWARQNTPIDAVFLVPPGETAFRLYAQRAIVINFKHVPQLGGELPIWLDRLRDVLGANDLNDLPRGYNAVLDALDQRYESRTPQALLATAEKYEARFMVVDHPLDPQWHNAVAYQTPNGHFFVYDRQRIVSESR